LSNLKKQLNDILLTHPDSAVHFAQQQSSLMYNINLSPYY